MDKSKIKAGGHLIFWRERREGREFIFNIFFLIPGQSRHRSCQSREILNESPVVSSKSQETTYLED